MKKRKLFHKLMRINLVKHETIFSEVFQELILQYNFNHKLFV